MSFYARAQPEQDFGSSLGQAIGQGFQGGFGMGLGQQMQRSQQIDTERRQQAYQQQQMQREQSALSQALSQARNDPQKYMDTILRAPVSNETKGLAIKSFQNNQKIQADQTALMQKQQQEQEESGLLARIGSGEKISQEERAKLSPKSQRTLLTAEKPVFEPTEEKLEAERVSKLADQITKDYDSAKNEDVRLARQEELSKKGNLTAPAMAKILDAWGIPLGVLNNQDTEEYAKLEADFVRDVSDVFPGQIRVYEIQAYLKTIPSLMNSQEGREAIFRNRKLMNEAKKVKYQAYKDVLKENNGRKPRNMDILIEEKVGNKLQKIAEDFRNGVEGALEKSGPSLRMKNSQGEFFDIPSHLVPDATKQGLSF